MKLEHDDACWQNVDIISMKCSNLNVVYMNFFYSHTDGRGCRARCQLDQEQFGVQYLAQGHSDMQLGGVGTRTSDWLLDNALYLLSYSRPKLWPLTLTCYPGDWGGGVTGCTEWLCYLLCLPLQAGFIFLHLCVCVWVNKMWFGYWLNYCWSKGCAVDEQRERDEDRRNRWHDKARRLGLGTVRRGVGQPSNWRRERRVALPVVLRERKKKDEYRVGGFKQVNLHFVILLSTAEAT